MKIKTLIFMFMGILLFGCTSEIDFELMKDKIIEANSNFDSYSVNLKMISNTEMDFFNQKIQSKSIMDTLNKISKKNKNMVMYGLIKTETLGMGIEYEIETYVVDNMQYTYLMDEWFKIELNQNLFDADDQISNYIRLFESSEFEILSEESINGKKYFVVGLSPDIKTLAELAIKQQSGLENLDFNLEESIKYYYIQFWINKENFILEKIYQEINMTLNIQDEFSGSSQELSFDSIVEMELFDFDEYFEFKLPKEALNATLLEDNDFLI